MDHWRLCCLVSAMFDCIDEECKSKRNGVTLIRLRGDESFDERISGLSIQRQSIAKRLELKWFFQEGLLKTTATSMEILFDSVESHVQDGALLRCQILLKLFGYFLRQKNYQGQFRSQNRIYQIAFQKGKLRICNNQTMTPLRALLTSCFPATLFLNSLDMSSIFALAAKFLALSVKFFRIICWIWNRVHKRFILNHYDRTVHELTLLSVMGGKTMVFSIVCMTIFHNSLSRRLSTAFSQDSA